MKNWVYDEISLIKAWIILSSVLMFFVVTEGQQEGGFSSPGIFDYISSVLFPFYNLICIRYIRGKTKTYNKPPYHQIEIGVWGYIWRGYVNILVSILPLLAVMIVALALNSVYRMPLLLSPIALLILIPFTAWLLFCKNRVNFAKKHSFNT